MKNRGGPSLLQVLVIALLLAVTMIVQPGLLPDRKLPRQAHSLAAPLDTCPPVETTPFFTIAYGPVTVNDTAASVGTVVEARSPRGDVVGCFVVSEPGHYGVMYIYGEDTTVDPSIPGMLPGEEVAFYVDGIAATSVPTLTWTNDHDLHNSVVDMLWHQFYLPVVARDG